MGFCKICTSPNRAAIDAALAAGEPRRSIARRFGLGESALDWHARKKHPPAESLADIGDEPAIVERRGSYDWVARQARARGKRVDEILALTRDHDPFYCGRELDVRNARWFAEAIVERFAAQIEAQRAAGVRPHVRGLHYLAVTAPPDNPVRWPHGAVYENTWDDWRRLGDYSRAARWLGYVDIEDFDDQRNAEPEYNAPSESAVEEPSVWASPIAAWALPEIDADLGVDQWVTPNIYADGYDDDRFLDQSSLVGVFIEKSTMNGWLVPLCQELDADLYVGSGVQSITNAARFIKRAADLGKAAHLLVISDFDPTGRKMPIAASRHVDYRRRMPEAKCDQWITVDLVALTPEQIDKFNLPRAPIKKTDPGIRRFQKLFGRGAVELDALESLHPGALEEIVRDSIDAYVDDDIGRKLSDVRESVDEAISDAWEREGGLEIQAQGQRGLEEGGRHRRAHREGAEETAPRAEGQARADRARDGRVEAGGEGRRRPRGRLRGGRAAGAPGAGLAQRVAGGRGASVRQRARILRQPRVAAQVLPAGPDAQAQGEEEGINGATQVPSGR